MIGPRKTIPTVLLALALAVVVRADMAPASCEAAVPQDAVAVSQPANSPASSAADVLGAPVKVDLDALSFAYLPEGNPTAEDAGATTEPVRLLGENGSSLELCLYALMGLGACRTAPWFKKLSLGFIPDWYHHGGPYQIGGSHAVDPDCLCSAVVCFVQPEHPADNVSPRCLQGTFVSLLLHSQCTPTVLASRGPPSVTRESSLV